MDSSYSELVNKSGQKERVEIIEAHHLIISVDYDCNSNGSSISHPIGRAPKKQNSQLGSPCQQNF